MVLWCCENVDFCWRSEVKFGMGAFFFGNFNEGGLDGLDGWIYLLGEGW